jgi:hypothetical protein
MELKKKAGRNIEIGPIHIIGEFVDDASQQSQPAITDSKKNQAKKRRKKNKRDKR